MQAPANKSPPGLDAMVASAAAAHCLQWVHAICMLLGLTGLLSAYFVPCDRDLWHWHSIHHREGPNTSSLWIWCKSVQPSPRYPRHKQENARTDRYLHAIIMMTTTIEITITITYLVALTATTIQMHHFSYCVSDTFEFVLNIVLVSFSCSTFLLMLC